MKLWCISLVSVVLLSGCFPNFPKVISENTYSDNVVVTSFEKRYKHQRIVVRTSDGIVIDQYVAKRCSGCAAQVGDKFNVNVTKAVWDDGDVTYNIDRSQTKDFLRK
ncbi:hypothetical protein 65p233 [Aeromonas phage 65]|uniref:Lipoprotein n=2 Tax=Ishigurovirus osborne TaxID=260149 RepID=A0A219YC83_9CAUD|nr:hypothetical protein ST65p233 [Aeromonas phage 65]ADQ53241.1 hypothetical protein 65p233 [Aeromonas phage 65]APU01616.1 hypothetical protein [Aeromonas phage 65.2]